MPQQAPSTEPMPSDPRLRRRWARYAIAACLLAAAAVFGLHWRAGWPRRHFERALAGLDAGRFEEVRAELATLETAAAYEPHCHFLRGALLLAKRQPFPALEQFGYSVNDPELRTRTLALSGQALYQVQRFGEAVGLLSQAVEADPEAVEARRWLALAYYDLGLIDPAIAQLAKVADLAPSDPRPHRLMGLMYKDFEHYDVAIEKYRESFRRDAGQSDGERIRLEMAECQIKLERLDDALATLAPCRPAPERWTKEAECHWLAGRADRARPLLEQTLKQSPADLSALLLSGTLALQEGKAGAAVDAFTRATTAYPKDYVAHYKLSLAYRRAGRREEADRHARISEQLKRVRQEFTKLHETAAAEPNNADARCRLGVLARELDRPDLARGWFQAALAIDPRHAETLRQLGAMKPPPAPDRPK